MGLGNLEFTTPLTASYDFEDWLRSDQFVALVEDYRRKGEEPSCLLDIITLWVMHTDALLNYPTFQTFLLSVLEITNQWQRDTQVFFGGLLWPSPQEASEDGLWIKSLAGDHENAVYGREVTSHAVMREENFLLHRARLQNGEPPIAATR